MYNEEEIKIRWDEGVPFFSDTFKKFLITRIVNHFALIESDKPPLIKAIMLEEWDNFTHNAWYLSWSAWQAHGPIWEVGKYIDMVKIYTRAQSTYREKPFDPRD